MTVEKALTPFKSSAIYKAAELIITAGPRSMEVLQAEIDMGPKHARQKKLDHAFDIDWLCETPAGTIDVTEKTREHFASLEQSSKPIGQITPAQYRPNVFASQGLSKKNIPSSRGLRLDIPDWSQRPEGFGFKSIAGGPVVSASFKIGDIVILRNDPSFTVDPEIKRLEGEEITVIGELRLRHLGDGPFFCYMVWHPSCQEFFCAPHELHRRPPRASGEQMIRAMFNVSALDVVLVDPDFASLPAQDALAHKGFDSMSVCIENGLQAIQIRRLHVEHVLNRLIFDETTPLLSIDFNRESDAPVVAIDYGNRWKFDVHFVARLKEKAIVTC